MGKIIFSIFILHIRTIAHIRDLISVIRDDCITFCASSTFGEVVRVVERCVTLRMMADEFGVKREMICQILVEDLGKRKVVSRFVPHTLHDDHRHERVQYAKDIVKTARRNKNFLNSIVARMKLGVFAMIPQLNAKVLNGSHQHHQKAKRFVFNSQK